MSAAATVWRERIEQQRGSGLPIRRFCEQEGVSSASFFAWRKRLASKSAPMFLPVSLVGPIQRSPAVELERTDGTLLRIFDGAQRQTLIDVLAALAGASA